MTMNATDPDPIVFSPNLRAGDPLANYWMRQVTLRLRRELAWAWHERGAASLPSTGELPPITDRTAEVLDLSRHWAEKHRFFNTDPTALYLTEQLRIPPPDAGAADRGSFGWVVRELELDNVSAFALALGLAAAFDASSGAVIASCLNDARQAAPTLALAQRLWDYPEDVLTLADPMHRVFAFGLLRCAAAPDRSPLGVSWDQPLSLPPVVARALLGAGAVVPAGVRPLAPPDDIVLTETGRLIACRLRVEAATSLRVVPLLGARRGAYRSTAAAIAEASNLPLWEYCGDAALLSDADYLTTLVTFAWLTGRGLYIGHELFGAAAQQQGRRDLSRARSTPVTLFVPVTHRRDLAELDHRLVLPVVDVAAPAYEARLRAWRRGFGDAAAALEPILKEAARRFRYEIETIRSICRELGALPSPLTADDVFAACRAELHVELGELATLVEPRFAGERLILPNKQAIQFDEQIAAVEALTTVHYQWGTARVWNEGGITVLFAGPPGTGKTMAAEMLAQRLKLPMYRIDLSQVVNKYIGETEKNLKRVFDAAEATDLVLFFDEADATFGRRLEATDARDRYANLEVSYLLERMERFKGVAILATNRKNDLDPAFLRRIRYVIDFPIPDEPQRASIWRQSIPPAVAEHSRIDVAFLARQFPLAGGHIRSIVFNACLQSAHACPDRQELRMTDVLVAVKREYDKINRSLSPEQLGPYAADLAGLD